MAEAGDSTSQTEVALKRKISERDAHLVRYFQDMDEQGPRDLNRVVEIFPSYEVFKTPPDTRHDSEKRRGDTSSSQPHIRIKRNLLSPNGSYFALLSEDDFGRLYNPKTGKILLREEPKAFVKIEPWPEAIGYTETSSAGTSTEEIFDPLQEGQDFYIGLTPLAI